MAARKILQRTLRSMRPKHRQESMFYRNASSNNVERPVPSGSRVHGAVSAPVAGNLSFREQQAPHWRTLTTSSGSPFEFDSSGERHITTKSGSKSLRFTPSTSLPDALVAMLHDNAYVASVIGPNQTTAPVDVCISHILNEILGNCFSAIDYRENLLYKGTYFDEKCFGHVQDLLHMKQSASEIDNQLLNVLNQVCGDVGELASKTSKTSPGSPSPFSARLHIGTHIETNMTLFSAKNLMHSKGSESIFVPDEHGVFGEIHYQFLVAVLLKNVTTRLSRLIDLANY